MSSENLNFEELKLDYLDKQEEGTSTNIRYVLLGEAVRKLEQKYKKDLAQFDIEVLKELMGDFQAKTESSLASRLSIINKYVDYAVAKGYVEMNNTIFITGDMLKDFLDTRAVNMRYIDINEFNAIKEVCKNYQDLIILELPWEGILGEKCIEARNLSEKDIDFDNNIIHIRDENERSIRVLDKTIKIIKGAIDEEEYEVYLNENSDDIKFKGVRYLRKTPHIIRKSTSGKNDIISYDGFVRRLKDIAKWYGNPFITPTTLWWSGMFHYLGLTEKEKGKLDKDDYWKIMERYGCPMNDSYVQKVKNMYQKHGKK